MKYVGYMLVFLTCINLAHAALLNPGEAGFGGQSRSANYDSLLDAMFSNGKVVTTIGDKLWVPWFRTSSSCQAADLQSGGNCNMGTAIDFTHNCMVTDEYSQVGILVAMGKDQKRMDQFYNTVIAIKSTNGNLPAWRVDRNGDTIEVCKSGVDGNCDTASDATARIIIALFTASKNPSFTDSAQKTKYAGLAKTLSSDFLKYEVDSTCRPSSLGYGNICYWMAGGSNVKKAGPGSESYAYTGYFADGIIAMLMACSNTGDKTYCTVAKDFSLNYLQAADWDGLSFSTPPGMAFKWTNLGGVPKAQCTQSCNPLQWDDADAPRALGMCQANYYAKAMNVSLPALDRYCKSWYGKYTSDPSRTPLQFTPDGNAVSWQSGYFAQGLQALHNTNNPSAFKATIDNALKHYSPTSKTWDNTACFGVYRQAFPVRALGVGLGRDLQAVASSGAILAPQDTLPATGTSPPAPSNSSGTVSDNPLQTNPIDLAPAPSQPSSSPLSKLSVSCTVDGAACVRKSDTSTGACRSVAFDTAKGPLKIFACEKQNSYAELYLQSVPAQLTYKACMGTGCVDNSNGFAVFKITAASPVAPPPAVSFEGAPGTGNSTNNDPAIIPPTAAGIAQLGSSCSAGGVECTKKQDTIEGACRNIVYGTVRGDIQLQGCEKDSGYAELYKQGAPAGLDFYACLGAGCVDKYSGFARFLITASSTPGQPAPEPAQPAASGVSSLPITVQPSGSLVGDYMEGATCRKVQYNTQFGWDEAKVCDKGTGSYELYLLSEPNDASICVGDSCVGRNSGFASFTYP